MAALRRLCFGKVWQTNSTTRFTSSCTFAAASTSFARISRKIFTNAAGTTFCTVPIEPENTSANAIAAVMCWSLPEKKIASLPRRLFSRCTS